MARISLKSLGVTLTFLAVAGGGAMLLPRFAGDLSTTSTGAAEVAPQAKPPLVTVIEARKITFVDNVLVSGSLVPREEILIGPELDGFRITELLADEGDRVKAGQVLARLSKETLSAQLAQNAASLAKATAAIEQAKSQIAEGEATLVQAKEAFDRIKPLRQSGAASQATYEEREAAFRTARARLEALKNAKKFVEADKALTEAQGRELKVKLSFTDITTPVAGLISRRNARVGAVSSSVAEALFRIVKNGEVELAAEVPEFDMTKLKPGQKAKVDVGGVGERPGTVRLVSPEVDPATRLGRVRIFLGDGPNLRVGSFARGVISAGTRESVGVPSTAVLYDGGDATVLAVENGMVRVRPVKTGLLSGGEVEIVEGLKPGEIVVRRAGALLRDGENITPVFPDKTLSEAAR